MGEANQSSGKAAEAAPLVSDSTASALQIVALIVPALISCMVAIRVLSVAEWDLNTAYVVLQEQGSFAVLIGTLISLLPMLTLAFFMAVLYYGLPDQRKSRSRYVLMLLLCWLVGTIGVLSLPLVGLVVGLAILIAKSVVDRRFRNQRDASEKDRRETDAELERTRAAIEEIDAAAEQLSADFERAQESNRLDEESDRLVSESQKIVERNRELIARTEAELIRLEADHIRIVALLDKDQRTKNKFAGAFGVALAWILVTSIPWLPYEQIGSDRQLVGWVLSQTSDRMVVLQRSPRQAIQLPPNTPHRYCDPRMSLLIKPAFVVSLFADAGPTRPCRAADQSKTTKQPEASTKRSAPSRRDRPGSSQFPDRKNSERLAAAESHSQSSQA